MRITGSMKELWINQNTTRLAAQQQEALEQASTGRRINAPSDDPVLAAEYARQQARLQQTAAFRSNITYVLGDVELIESTLAEAGDLLQRVREVAMQGANDSTSPDQREALAAEVGSLREALLGLANTRGSRGTLFGGSQTAGPAFDPSGAYLGDASAQRVAVAPQVVVTVEAVGMEAFAPTGGRNVFADLAALENALASGDGTEIRALLDVANAAHDQVLGARGSIGITLARLRTSDEILAETELRLQTSAENAIGIAAHEAYSNLVNLNQTLEASIATTRTVLDTSLLRSS